MHDWLEWGGTQQVIDRGLDPAVMLAQSVAEDSAAAERTYRLVDAFLSRVARLI